MKKTLLLFSFLFLLLSTSFAQKEDVLRVLAIGNSFSEDALENYLYDLAKAADKKIVIGNLYIAGAPMTLHVKNAQENKKNYAYRKIALDGKKEVMKNVSIEDAMDDERWDIISLQQSSSFSGQYTIIMQDLPELIRYVKSQAPNAKLVYHQTWAYQQDSNHKAFVNYNKNQLTMYDSIIDATKKINKLKDFIYIAPAGTAIQNARTSSLGDKLTRDGYHLELNYGRFIAACVWYEKLFGLDVRKNSWKPEKVTTEQAKIAKESAHKAVKKPFKISQID